MSLKDYIAPFEFDMPPWIKMFTPSGYDRATPGGWVFIIGIILLIVGLLINGLLVLVAVGLTIIVLYILYAFLWLGSK